MDPKFEAGINIALKIPKSKKRKGSCFLQGYIFVSHSEILNDKAYQHPLTKHGNWGISWIDRWALSEGMRGDFFKGDPRIPDYITELSK